MIFDSHIHTTFSTDSNMKITDAMKTAKINNVGLVITDHMDLNYPKDIGFRFNPEEYFNEYGNLRGDSLLLGIEVGMCNDFKNENNILIKKYPFDQVIGSIHTINNQDIGYPSIYQNASYEEILEKYFNEMITCILSHPDINTLGHIDYISRYAPVKDSEIHYNTYKNFIDKVLKTCIDTNTAMEINTRRIGYKSAFLNLKSIYSRYKELGGNYVTIGSDSHNCQSIGNNFKEALLMCELCNLTPVYFKNRNPEFF